MPPKSTSRKKMSRATRRDLDTRIEFMEGIVRRDPDYVDALQLLGDDYTQRGRFPEGLRVDERLACLEPQNSLVFYNLACSCSLTEQYDRALAALEKAMNLGYRDFAWLAKDPDLKKLRAQPIYRAFREKLRRLKKKNG
jgi:tetratricopeptide (TPR) repeat protein